MQATAFIIGAEGQCNQGLMDLSLDIGFRTVLNFTDLSVVEQQVKRTPICFFLFALTCSAHSTPGISRSIRSSSNRQIMYAPMVGFTENPEPRLIEATLRLGFDDILVPPFSAKSVAPRINSHINRRITFFETAHYFGPDRRVGEGIHKEPEPHPDRGKGGDHRKVLISRNLETGVSILKDEFHRAHRSAEPDKGISIAI